MTVTSSSPLCSSSLSLSAKSRSTGISCPRFSFQPTPGLCDATSARKKECVCTVCIYNTWDEKSQQLVSFRRRAGATQTSIDLRGAARTSTLAETEKRRTPEELAAALGWDFKMHKNNRRIFIPLIFPS